MPSPELNYPFQEATEHRIEESGDSAFDRDGGFLLLPVHFLTGDLFGSSAGFT